MTDDKKIENKAEDSAIAQTPYLADWALVGLVNFVNANKVSIGVTLTVGGALISGSLISGKEFFDKIAEKFNQLNPEKGSLAEYLAKYHSQISEEVYVDGDLPINTVFIHLDNARQYFGKESIPTVGTLWRGRLCDISGFSIGELTAS